MTDKTLQEDGKTGARPIDKDNADAMHKADTSRDLGQAETTAKEGKRPIDKDNSAPMVAPDKSLEMGQENTVAKEGKRPIDKNNADSMPTPRVKNVSMNAIDEGVESPTKGTKKVASYGDHNHTAEVRYNHDWEEYQVHHYKAGKHQGEGPVSYHGSDRKDAHDTAKHTVGMNESADAAKNKKMESIDDSVESKVVFEQEDVSVKLSEDIKALLEAIEMPEAHKTQALGLFEGAVAGRIADIKKEMFAVNEAKMSEYKIQLSEKVEKDTDTYVSEAVAKWLEENKTEVKSNLRTQIAESFMGGLLQLLETHYVTVPEGKEDILETALAKVEELEIKLDETVKENDALKESTLKTEKALVVESLVKSLTDTQAERVKQLAESVVFDSQESYTIKLQAIVESISKSNTGKASEFLTEDAKGDIQITEKTEAPKSKVDPLVEQLMKDLERLKK